MMTVEENRKKVRKNNLLISLLFCLMIIGVAGAAYYYRNLKIAKTNVLRQKKELETLKDTLANQNERLESLVDSIINFKNILDSISRTTYVSNDFSRIQKNLDKLLQPAIHEKSNRDSARQHARDGYDKLIKKDFIGAMNDFGKSEKFYNGYHESYEIHMLLRKNQDKLGDPAVQRQLLEKIKKDYNSLQKLNSRNIQ
jgi:cell division protein FtsB